MYNVIYGFQTPDPTPTPTATPTPTPTPTPTGINVVCTGTNNADLVIRDLTTNHNTTGQTGISTTVNSGDSVQFEATPANGYYFVSCNDGTTTFYDRILNFTITSTKTIAYRFEPINVQTYDDAKTALICYGYNYTEIDLNNIANKINMLITEFNGTYPANYYPIADEMNRLKLQSPQIKILGYKDILYSSNLTDDWTTVSANSAWFLKDGSGNYIYNTYWNMYLMDISNAGWYGHITTYLASKFAQTTAYTGVLLDDCQDTIPNTSLNATPTATAITNWHNYTIHALEQIKGNLTEKLVICNTNSGWEYEHFNNDYSNVTDGIMIEGFIHASWDNQTYNSKSTAIPYQKSLYANLTAQGKTIVLASGCTDVNQTLKNLCIEAFLEYSTGNEAYFAWNQGTYYGINNQSYNDFGGYLDELYWRVTKRTYESGIIRQYPTHYSSLYINGYDLNLTAIPSTHHSFVNWIINGTNSTSNPLIYTVLANLNITAVFAEIPQYRVYLYRIGDGYITLLNGTTYNENNTLVRLNATAYTNRTFINWIINGTQYIMQGNSTDNPLSIVQTGTLNITAVFNGTQTLRTGTGSSSGSTIGDSDISGLLSGWVYLIIALIVICLIILVVFIYIVKIKKLGD